MGCLPHIRFYLAASVRTEVSSGHTVELYSFDDDYVRRLRDGDRWTEEHFHEYFNELLLIKLRSRMTSLHAIDDVRQEVFVRVFRTLRSADGIQCARKIDLAHPRGGLPFAAPARRRPARAGP